MQKQYLCQANLMNKMKKMGKWRRRKRNAHLRQQTEGIVIIGGPNVRRIAFATWENFDSDKGVIFESITDGTIGDVLNSMEKTSTAAKHKKLNL